jgi:hypothetical protein
MKRIISALFALLFLSSQVLASDWLINSYRFAVAVAPTVTFVACTTNTTSLTTYSYASAGIGTAGARTVIVATLAVDTGQSSFGTSSMTIGGTAAAEQADTNNASEDQQASIYTLDVPTGTTATIAVTYSEAISYSTICVWAAYNLASSTKRDFAAAVTGSSTVTLSMDTLVNSINVGGCIGHTSGANYTWTGLTERNDTSDGEASFSAADFTSTTAQTPRTITCANSTGAANVSGAAVNLQ